MPNLSRRDFLSAAATTAAIAIVPAHVLGGPAHKPPSEKLNIAGIGVGGMGAGNLGNLPNENIVALCDVDLNYAAKTIKKYPKAKIHTDYRKMLDDQKDIDACVIATPDHTHAVITMACMRAGKHVYTQKPLTHDIYESRMLAKAAKETGVITQMGIQGHSNPSTRTLVEWVQAGAIGEVREVDAWCSLTYFPWGHAWWSTKWSRRPSDTPPVPKNLNWDLWLGPAPERPYHPAYHPAVWRAWWDFGNGMMGDRGAHTFNPVVWALKLGLPTSVEATQIKDLNPDTHPISCIVTYQFPARGELPPVKLTWYDGLVPAPPKELPPGKSMGNKEGGALFKGSKGLLTCGVYGETVHFIPEERLKDYNRPPQTIPRIKISHEEDWARCCKSGEQPGANFDYSAMLNEICLLGNVAKHVTGPIEYDGANMKITNVPEANKYLRCEYRKGWSL